MNSGEPPRASGRRCLDKRRRTWEGAAIESSPKTPVIVIKSGPAGRLSQPFKNKEPPLLLAGPMNACCRRLAVSLVLVGQSLQRADVVDDDDDDDVGSATCCGRPSRQRFVTSAPVSLRQIADQMNDESKASSGALAAHSSTPADTIRRPGERS
jgi:hypothetical protein